MSNKIDRAHYGPSWTEVILGAVLSIVLGVVLAAAYLIFKPVTLVKEIPKEPVEGTVYYIEGSHDTSKAKKLVAKQKTFLQGGSIDLIEDELNLAVIPPPPAPVKGAPPAPAPEQTTLVNAGVPNFRIATGKLQLSVPVHVKVALVGLDTTFMLQTQGGFVKDGDVFVYQPDVIYLGSCPVHRIPVLKKFVMKKFVNANVLPADLSAAWAKLSDVTIDGSTLKLGMPKP
jgi:hypothetical protein